MHKVHFFFFFSLLVNNIKKIRVFVFSIFIPIFCTDSFTVMGLDIFSLFVSHSFSHHWVLDTKRQ